MKPKSPNDGPSDVLNAINSDIDEVNLYLQRIKKRNIADSSKVDALTEELDLIELMRDEIRHKIKTGDLDTFYSSVHRLLFPKIELARKMAEELLKPKLSIYN